MLHAIVAFGPFPPAFQWPIQNAPAPAYPGVARVASSRFEGSTGGRASRQEIPPSD
jgi:hypothetical protein